ncbi:hypothetical protein GCM10010452_14230 [Crossiella cryophila]
MLGDDQRRDRTPGVARARFGVRGMDVGRAVAVSRDGEHRLSKPVVGESELLVGAWRGTRMQARRCGIGFGGD